MAQKRKIDVDVVDEFDKKLSSIFQRAANNLTQLYNQASSQQKIAFDTGKKHALVDVLEWLDKKQQKGDMVTPADIRNYLQDEINDCMTSAGMQEESHNNSVKSSACGHLGSELDSCSSTVPAHGQENIEDGMEVEMNPQDAAK